MLRPGPFAEILPSEYQLAGLRLWPPPRSNEETHHHGSEAGQRCTSTIVRYGRDKAQCVRCGRVWINRVNLKSLAPRAESPTIETLRSNLRVLNLELEVIREKREELRRKFALVNKRRKRLVENLKVWEETEGKDA